MAGERLAVLSAAAQVPNAHRPVVAGGDGDRAPVELTDSALIIDAMDLLYAGNLEGFVIVSSDSDFTRLRHGCENRG